MEIWLCKSNTDKIKLPINPQEIGSEFSTNFNDHILASGKERTTLAGENLRLTTISSFFPANRTYYMSTTGLLEPMEYVNIIEKWMRDEANYLLLQVTTTNINRYVTIRKFDWHEVGGAVGDIEYTLELKEFKPIVYEIISKKDTKKTSTSKSKKPASSRPPSSKAKPKSYTVKKGDSLSKISLAIYGTANRHNDIYNANIKTIGKNPNKIKPGQVLVIPK